MKQDVKLLSICNKLESNLNSLAANLTSLHLQLNHHPEYESLNKKCMDIAFDLCSNNPESIRMKVKKLRDEKCL